MKCEKCGNKLTGKENFCRICGTPVRQEETKESMPNEKSNVDKIKKSNNSTGKKIQLTGNIDVTKIKIVETETDNIEDVSGDEIKITKESADKEFKAMLEITSTENQPKRSLDVNDDLDVSLVDDNNILDKIDCTDKFKTKDSEMSINIMPGEANTLEIQSTTELEELLSDNSQNNNIVKCDLTEKTSLEPDKNTENELNESTMFVPDELITNKNEEIDINTIELKTKELDEVTTPILPVAPKLEKINDSSTQIDSEKKLIKEEVILNHEENVGEKSEEVSNSEGNSLSISKDEKEKYTTPPTNENNITQELNSFVNNDNNDIQTSPQPIQARNGRKIGILILALLLIMCILGLGYLGYRLFISNDELNDLKNENKSLNDKLAETQDVNSNQQLSNDNVTSLKINGYDILLDDTNEYAIEGDRLLIKSAQNDIVVHFGLNIDYTTIKEDKDSYKELLVENDYEVKSYGTKVVDNREYVVYEVETKENGQMLVAYTSLSDKSTICFMISDNDNEIDYDFLNTTNKFIDSLKINYSYEDTHNDFFIKEENAS